MLCCWLATAIIAPITVTAPLTSLLLVHMRPPTNTSLAPPPPAYKVFVSPMFLVGEVPSAMGLCGVAVVSLAGYKLGLLGAADTAALSQQAGKTKQLPLLPTGAKGSTGSAASADHEHHQQLIPAAELRSWEADHSTAGAAVQSRPYQRQPAQLVPPQAGSPELHTGVNGTTTSSSGVSAAQSLGGVDAHQQQQQLGGLHSVGTSHRSSSSNGGGGRLKQKSAWAIAYYKQKSPPLGVWEAACGGLQSAAQQLLGAGMSPRSSAAASAAHNVFGVGSSNGHHMLPSSSLGGGGGVSSEGVNGSGVLSSSDSAGSTSSSSLSTGGSNVVWVDSQAKGSKDPKLLSELSTKRGGVGASGGANGSSGSGGVFPPPRKRRWMRRLSWLRAPWLRLARAVAGPAKLLSGPTAGPALVLIVAFLYSLTASMDKLGMGASASTAFYIMVQRLLIASASSVYLLCGSPRTLRHLYSDALLLVSMSLVEQAAVVLYFKAIQNILVRELVCLQQGGTGRGVHSISLHLVVLLAVVGRGVSE